MKPASTSIKILPAFSCKLYHKPTRFETCIFRSLIPCTFAVANYTTNQLGLKHAIHIRFICNLIGCKLYHKPTRFETTLNSNIISNTQFVANYTTNQLGLKPHISYYLRDCVSGCKLYHKPTRFETDCFVSY